MVIKKYVYRIVNITNGKSYVGQSIHPQKRFLEHTRKSSNSNPKITRAVSKYGKNNFQLEILYYGEDYNAQEKYYIKKFDSINNGYNIAEGGEEPPVLKGEKHHNSKLTINEVQKIKELLLEKTPKKKIYKMFPHICECQIDRINCGKGWKEEGLSYPLCNYSMDLELSTVELIISDIKNTKMSLKAIGQKYNVAKSTIVAINNGKTNGAKVLENDFPIRKLNNNRSLVTNKEKIKKIQQMLILSDKSNKEIANMYDISVGMIQNIIAGRTYKNNQLSYPLRQKESKKQ